MKKLFRTGESLTIQDIHSIWKEVKKEGYEYVDLSYNRVDIPEMIIPKNIPSLKYLYLYKSKIKKIKLEGNLPRLQILHLGENQLKEFTLPSGFESLEHLRLDKNQLEDFEIINPGHLKNMQSLFLEGNKIDHIEASFWNKEGNCWNEVKTVLKAIDVSGGIINNEAKVIWFGNGMAGKTTLSEQIRTTVFPDIQEANRTHGILIKDWVIPYEKDKKEFGELKELIEKEIQEEKERKPDIDIVTPKNIILRMWDFGGQEYYHATHRLFLNNNVMYLLVWDEQTEKQDEDKGMYPREYWRENIRYYAEKDKVILEIQNQVKEAVSTDHKNNVYKVDFRNEDEVRSVQKYEWDVEDLEKGIISRLHQLNFLGRIFPKAYDEIRVALRGHESNYLNYTEYRKFCQENDPTRNSKEALMLDEVQLRTLTGFLDNTGAIICYRNKSNCPKGLEDLVFLKPEWVTEKIYKILAENIIHHGEFDLGHAARQTQDSGLSAEQWISLMKQFKLIFEIEKKGKTLYIAPQYLGKECPNPEAKEFALEGKKMKDGFSLHYHRFLSKSIFLEFLTEYGSASKSFLYWKYGLIFFVKGKTIYATCNYQKRIIDFKVQDGDKEVIHQLFNWFEKEGKLNTATEVRLNSEAVFVNINQLKKNLSKGIPKFINKNYTISCEDYEELFFDKLKGLFFNKLRGNKINSHALPKKLNTLEKHPNPPVKKEQRAGDKIILILAANPKSTGVLDLNTELKKIKKSLKRSKKRIEYDLEFALKATINDLRKEITEESPTVVHFSGHGSHTGELIFEAENGEPEIATVKAVSDFFEIFKDEIDCVILNTCYSQEQGHAIAQHIPIVVGMKKAIPDKAAIEFSEAFYDAIFAGRDYIQSFKLGKNAIQLKKMAADLIPVLFIDGKLL